MWYVSLWQKTFAPCDMHIDAVLCPFLVDNSINRKNLKPSSRGSIHLLRCHVIMVWCHSFVMSLLFDVIVKMSWWREINIVWNNSVMVSLLYDLIMLWLHYFVMFFWCDVTIAWCHGVVLLLCHVSMLWCHNDVISPLCDVIILWCHYGWMSSYNGLTCKTVDFAVASVFDSLNDVGDVV